MSAVTATILIGGSEIDPTIVLTHIDVILELNRLPYAQITLLDGDAPSQEFKVSNTAGMTPGAEVEIKLRYEGFPDSEGSVFKGVIVRHSLEATSNSSTLTLDLKDKAVKMTAGRKNAVFRDITDDQVIKQLIENNGLTPGELVATKAQHKELTQYAASDWDFMLARAEANGCWVQVAPDGIALVNPAEIDTGSPMHTLVYGMDEIYRFQVEADGESQFESVESAAWDLPGLAVTSPVQAEAFQPGPGDLDPAAMASAIGNGGLTLQNISPLLNEEIQSWADACLRKSRLAMVRGSLCIKGQADIFPLDVLELGGIGDHFNGNVLITGVRHRVSTLGWRTDVQFGLQPDWHVNRPDIMSPSAGGLLPGVRGLQIGIAEAFEKDPDEHYRIRVRIPAWGEEAGPVWARLATPDGGNERGFFFLPEVGDELVLGFLHEDPRQVIVLGSLYSQGQPPPVPADKIDENNFLKGLYSREGIKVEVDEENKAITIWTSDQQQIALHEKEKKIEIKDLNGNTIVMNDSGITIKSAKNLVLEATKNVEIKGQKVDVK